MTKSNSKTYIMALVALAATLMAHETKANCYVQTYDNYGCNTGWAQPACAVVTPGWGAQPVVYQRGYANCGDFYQGGCAPRMNVGRGYRHQGGCAPRINYGGFGPGMGCAPRHHGGCASRVNYGGFGPGMGYGRHRGGNCGGMKIRHNGGCGPRMRGPKMHRGCGPRGGRGRGRGF